MARALKVYRTPIGFHDAYVAAPSQKAALEAWGADANLFARGVAEVVTDADLTREPLEKPGTVVRRLRGTAAEHLAALPEDRPKRVRPPSSPPAAKPAQPRPPRPSRAKLDKAERALTTARDHHEAALADLRRREQALQQERRALEAAQDKEAATLETAAEAERARYEAALRDWQA